MRLSFIFDALATGELHNLYVSDGAEQIREEKKVALLPAINLALMDLCTRFFLRKKKVYIPTRAEQYNYSTNDDEFIELISLHHLASLEGNPVELPVNNSKDCYLISPSTVHFNNPFPDNEYLLFIFKARFKVLSQADIDNDTDIDLPMAYLNALLYFIASRAYTSIVNQLDGDLNESNRYAQKYVQEIAMLTNQGIDVDDFRQAWLFDERGFI